jgi:predicted protein tyrosine phosphatase
LSASHSPLPSHVALAGCEWLVRLLKHEAVVKVLFVCSQNRLRSLTAETIFDGLSGHQVRSVGTEEGARIRVTAGHLGWADLIFVMEKRQLHRLQTKFREEIAGKRIICLYIPDDYEYMDEELIDRLRTGVAEYIDFDVAAG